MTPRRFILDRISDERDRQERLKAAGRFAHTCADPVMSEFEKLACLGEEFGEVARATLEWSSLVPEHGTRGQLEHELIQVAAVAVAWLEAL